MMVMEKEREYNKNKVEIKLVGEVLRKPALSNAGAGQ